MRGPRWSTAALALAAAGCSAPVTGELIVAIQTDMAAPKDLDHLELHVLSGGKPVISNARFRLGPEDVHLPATQGLTVSEEPDREILIRARAILRDRTRVEHTVITTVPEHRVATLWVPLHFLCSEDSASPPGAPGRCPDDQTCFAGECRDRRVSSAQLPDYVEQDVLRRACFDAAGCFRGAIPAADLDPVACTIAASGDVNVAIATEGDGACDGSGCFVPLDAESDLGWRRRGDRIELPKALCPPDEPEGLARLGVVTSPVTPACPLKRIGDPICEVDGGRPVVLAARQRAPASLALSEDGVLWTEQGWLDDSADGAVKQVPLGGGAPATLAERQAVPRQIALDRASRRVLWTNRGVGGATTALMARSLDRDDTAPLLDAPRLGLLGPSGVLEGLATRGASLFWTQLTGTAAPGRVGRAALDGRMETALAGAASAYHVAAANSVVCWTDLGEGDGTGESGSVLCLKAGATEPVEVGSRQRWPYGIALDARDPTEVFWVNFGGEVVRGAVDKNSPEVIFQDHKNEGLYGVALDERSVYWTNRLRNTVSRLPRDAASVGAGGGEPPLTLAEGQRNPGAIAVDASAVYWINEGSAGQADGAVVRCAKPPPPR
ncbi:hypothetical protein WMF04_07010 [Sorangium sp. So ce260]|uniref:hypothetical protein n=1 Tax=Sorangium sp. So ce260 TaxID=3133291 RepID=UPI003F5E5E8A